MSREGGTTARAGRGVRRAAAAVSEVRVSRGGVKFEYAHGCMMYPGCMAAGACRLSTQLLYSCMMYLGYADERCIVRLWAVCGRYTVFME